MGNCLSSPGEARGQAYNVRNNSLGTLVLAAIDPGYSSIDAAGAAGARLDAGFAAASGSSRSPSSSASSTAVSLDLVAKVGVHWGLGASGALGGAGRGGGCVSCQLAAPGSGPIPWHVHTAVQHFLCGPLPVLDPPTPTPSITPVHPNPQVNVLQQALALISSPPLLALPEAAELISEHVVGTDLVG